MSIKVLIVDDEHLVRAGFRAILESQSDIEVVGEASHGAEGVEAARRLRPEVILMDIQMAPVNGIEATARLGNLLGDPTRVIMLTGFGLDEYVYEAMRAGASGFLLKNARPEDLIHAVRVVAAGEAQLAPSITRRLIEDFARQPKPPDRSLPSLDRLTERELEVLKILARGRSTAEIAEELFVSEATVKTHITHILTKLHLRDRPQAIVLAYESGLVQPGRESGGPPRP
ncbi:MAG: response regulator [Actinomycetota bacterium]